MNSRHGSALAPWPPAARIAKFREKAALLQANPVVQGVTWIRHAVERMPYGTFRETGTQVEKAQLLHLMLDARLFEQRNDSQILLETINNVVMTELKRQDRDDLAAEWATLRKAQREERNRWYKPGGPKHDNELSRVTW